MHARELEVQEGDFTIQTWDAISVVIVATSIVIVLKSMGEEEEKVIGIVFVL